MAWNRLRQFTGTAWILFGVGFFLADAIEAVQSRFPLRWFYYGSTWAYLILCAFSGTLLFGPVPLGRWLVTVVASLLLLYALLLWLEAGAGALVWFQLWCLAMLSFAIWSVFLVHRRKA